MTVPKRYLFHWQHPWTRKAKYSPGFRRWLHRQGLLSPHFSYAEAASKDGTPIPRRLRPKARNHAFNLERLRHALGGASLPVLSWYRTPAYNAQIGGAKNSQHMNAVATDFDATVVEQIGTQHFDAAAERVFAKGGFGQYPGGSRHVDSRGTRARWTSF